ncbi:hypothetical protein PALB_26430 [Pseudoalteromonas luteoviolacea B = ATCC 29581]|nr:hypothetical protein PALB_26430 [Pseudoalteromonas luteoviolacea B = ATCC 29581]
MISLNLGRVDLEECFIVKVTVLKCALVKFNQYHTARSNVQRIIEFIKTGQFENAKKEIRLTDGSGQFVQLMQLWFNEAMAQSQPEHALYAITKLQKLFPENPQYTSLFEQLLTHLERYEELVAFLETKKAKSLNDIFNLGFYSRKAALANKSIQYFEQALEKGITDPHEVYLNLALVYSEQLRDDAKAIEMLNKSLSLKPNYVSALHNLANLKEQHGLASEAQVLFEQILSLEPDNVVALARLSDLNIFDLPKALSYEKTVLSALQRNQTNPNAIDLLYGLGKVFDDAKHYDQAWHYYVQANQANKQTLPQYEKQWYEELITDCKTREFKIKPIDTDLEPIIVCGMFRSGSTLIERLIGASGEVGIGGEIAFLHRHFFAKSTSELMATLNERKLLESYARELRQVAGNHEKVTDKRPENFMYVDLVKALFPQAKFVWTRRNKFDNALSAYFQRLGPTQNYATDLDDILHYYQFQEHMLHVWQSKFPDTIHVVDYDELVNEPKGVGSALFNFLGLEYCNEHETFHQMAGGVKTASVWQVRRPLYAQSSGRIENYRDSILNCDLYSQFSSQLRN